MNKAILISIRPEHLLNILNGEKTLELRKTVPKDYVGWVYIYCTKAKQCTRVSSFIFVCEDELYKLPNGVFKYGSSIELMGIGVAGKDYNKNNFLNGKVVARFWFDEHLKVELDYQLDIMAETISSDELSKLSCLSQDKIANYFMNENGDVNGYVWLIKRLEIFDEPMSLSDLNIERPPQSWQYVFIKELENAI